MKFLISSIVFILFMSDNSALVKADVDVIIVGAGISGLAAAKSLQQRGYDVIVLEARNRIGGRIHTKRYKGLPIEYGAGWIHGPHKNPVTKLAKQSAAKTFVTNDDSVMVFSSRGVKIPGKTLTSSEKKFEKIIRKASRYATGKKPLSLEKAIYSIDNTFFNEPLFKYMITSYTEFDYGGAVSKLSATRFDSDESFKGDDVVITPGYDQVLAPLARRLMIHKETRVTGISYANDGVTVSTDKGSYEAYAAVITVPLGVLKSNTINFDPALPPEKTRAIKKIAMGNLMKVFLVYEKPFWPVDVQYFGYTGNSSGRFNYFLNCRKFSKVNALVTFAYADEADKLEEQSEKSIESESTAPLKVMFNNRIPRPSKLFITRWRKDPFSRGSYSYNNVAVTKNDFKELAKPVKRVLFFAGEHTSQNYRRTPPGAYLSRTRAASEVTRAIKYRK